jgi:CDP-glucose 4,6-dehydratase
MAFADQYRGKRVFVTGHTGFKGAWLCEWLLALGAEVTGYALTPPTVPALFDELGLADRLRHIVGDVRDPAALRAALDLAQPHFVFHLAAQPLVRASYQQPVETYAVNVLGTVHLLEAVRLAGRPCVVVAITTDKCYENKESGQSYHEDDPLGGHDPYSSSKAAAEIAISSYRRSFFSAPDSTVALASVRAGNVVGGGDWAADRIVPDCIRALLRGQAVPVRNKVAVRPWQHVLEPLGGYLWLGARLAQTAATAGSPDHAALCSAFNFGPDAASDRTVAEVVEEVLLHWPGRWEDRSDPRAVHEAKRLNLDIGKADRLLQWRPVWDFSQTIGETAAWYRMCAVPGVAPAATAAFTRGQIDRYLAAAGARNLPWTR